jgi:hypothetical protein
MIMQASLAHAEAVAAAKAIVEKVCICEDIDIHKWTLYEYICMHIYVYIHRYIHKQ